jgi:hypothetical protein
MSLHCTVCGASSVSEWCCSDKPKEKTGMTLIEAIRSGRPFRRGGEHLPRFSWHNVRGADIWTDDGHKIIITTHDLLATDWETKPAEVLVTRERFWRAVKIASLGKGLYCLVSGLVMGPKHASETDLGDIVSAEKLARELGLEGE